MNWLRKKLFVYLTKHLFSGVWEQDVFRQKNNKVFYKGKVMDKEILTTVKEDAERFQDSIIWKILKDECAYQANLKMYKSGIRDLDVLAGRMMLHNLEVIENVIEKLKSLR